MEIWKAYGSPKYEVYKGAILFDGDELLKKGYPPAISLLIQGYWITMYAEDLLVDVSDYGDASTLMLLVLENDYELFIMGQPALQQYYMSFDMESSIVSVIPDSYTTKPYLLTGSKPTCLLGSTCVMMDALALISGLSLLIVALGTV